MTHATCRLTAKNWDQLQNPHSVIEYGLPYLVSHTIASDRFVISYMHVGRPRLGLSLNSVAVLRWSWSQGTLTRFLLFILRFTTHHSASMRIRIQTKQRLISEKSVKDVM